MSRSLASDAVRRSAVDFADSVSMHRRSFALDFERLIRSDVEHASRVEPSRLLSTPRLKLAPLCRVKSRHGNPGSCADRNPSSTGALWGLGESPLTLSVRIGAAATDVPPGTTYVRLLERCGLPPEGYAQWLTTTVEAVLLSGRSG